MEGLIPLALKAMRRQNTRRHYHNLGGGGGEGIFESGGYAYASAAPAFPCNAVDKSENNSFRHGRSLSLSSAGFGRKRIESGVPDLGISETVTIRSSASPVSGSARANNGIGAAKGGFHRKSFSCVAV